MNIHEYQAKAVLKEFGVPVSRGVPVLKVEDAEAAAKELGGPLWVVKSQIHAGGRGKGKFKEAAAGEKGGVRLAKSIDEVKTYVKEMLGNTLVTIQTGPAGKQVNRLYIEDGSDIEKEFYLSALVDRATSRVVLRRFHRRRHGHRGSRPFDSRKDPSPSRSIRPPASCRTTAARVAKALNLSGDLAKQAGALVAKLYKAFVEKDMAMLEINPLIVTKQGELKCLDAKVSFDSNALYRHPDIARAARRDRRRRQGNRSLEIRPVLHHARRRDRLHGQRRRPRHGDDGHHQALWRWSPPTSSTSAAAPPRRRSRRRSRSSPPTRMSKASWSTSSAASCAATSSPKA